MSVRFVHRPLAALHAEVFLPAGWKCPHQLLHVVEHRLFLHPALRDLEDDVVRHEGWAEYSGLRLSLTVPPRRAGALLAALREVLSGPLPPMEPGERERFAREMELGGEGGAAARALDLWRARFADANGLAAGSPASEDAVWASLRSGEPRILLVGDRAACGGLGDEGDWAAPAADFVFPQVQGELPAWAPKAQAGFGDGPAPDDDGYGPDEGFEPLVPAERSGCRYAVLLPSPLAGPAQYAAHVLIFEVLRARMAEQYSDAGRTYDPVAFHRWEDGMVLSGLDIDTLDTSARPPKFPKCPQPEDFAYFRDALAFQLEIDGDRLVLDGCTSAGLLPDARPAAVRALAYGEFRAAWDAAKSRACVAWCWD